MPFSLLLPKSVFSSKRRKIIKNLATHSDEYGIYVKTTFEIISSHNDKIVLFVKNNTVWKWVCYKTEWMFYKGETITKELKITSTNTQGE